VKVRFNGYPYINDESDCTYYFGAKNGEIYTVDLDRSNTQNDQYYLSECNTYVSLEWCTEIHPIVIKLDDELFGEI
jgi:hypothetical protein